jgi:hypothetical protein
VLILQFLILQSWSTTHDSQESAQNPGHSGFEHSHNPQTSDPEQHSYLTDYETANITESQEYPTSISDSTQDLYATSSPPRPEVSATHVQTSSSIASIQSPPWSTRDLQTPNRPQPHTGYQNTQATTYPQPQNLFPFQRTINPSPFQTPISQPPVRSLEDGEAAAFYASSLIFAETTHAPSHTVHALLPPVLLPTPFTPVQPHYPQHDEPPLATHLQTPVSAPSSTSEPLNRYVNSDNEESWSPAAHPTPGSHKRRIWEADETVHGFRENKLRAELDQIAERGDLDDGGQLQLQPPRKRRRRGKGREKGSNA